MTGYLAFILALLLVVAAPAGAASPVSCEQIVGPPSLLGLLVKYQRADDVDLIVSKFKGHEAGLFVNAKKALLSLNVPFQSNGELIALSSIKGRILSILLKTDSEQTVQLLTELISEAEPNTYLAVLYLQRDLMTALQIQNAQKVDLLSVCQVLDRSFDILKIGEDILWPNLWVLLRDVYRTSQTVPDAETKKLLESLANRYIAFWNLPQNRVNETFADHRISAMNDVR